MPWSQDLTMLCNRIVALYPTEADARYIIAGAGLDSAFIPFSSQAINTWQSILTQAELRNKVGAIVHTVLSEYVGDGELTDAYQAYMDSIGRPATPPISPSDPTA